MHKLVFFQKSFFSLEHTDDTVNKNIPSNSNFFITQLANVKLGSNQGRRNRGDQGGGQVPKFSKVPFFGALLTT
jgi:hypothetical protein